MTEDHFYSNPKPIKCEGEVKLENLDQPYSIVKNEHVYIKIENSYINQENRLNENSDDRIQNGSECTELPNIACVKNNTINTGKNKIKNVCNQYDYKSVTRGNLKRQSRENETAEEKRARLDWDLERRRLKRQEETENERHERLARENTRRRLRRERETPEERQSRLERVRNRRRVQREKATPEQIRARLEEDAERRRVRRRNRTKQSTAFQKIATNDESTVPEDYLGKMEIVYTQCSPLNFVEERTENEKLEFTRSCKKGQVKLESSNEYPDLLKHMPEDNDQNDGKIIKLENVDGDDETNNDLNIKIETD